MDGLVGYINMNFIRASSCSPDPIFLDIRGLPADRHTYLFTSPFFLLIYTSILLEFR